MIEKYPKDIKIVHKNFPLRNHPYARPAALAAMAAHKQGKFWPFHDKVFENFSRLSNEKLDEIAKELGLDMVKFKNDMKSPTVVSHIENDLKAASLAEVRGTPTIFINGRAPQGRSMEIYSDIIEKELRKHKK